MQSEVAVILKACTKSFNALNYISIFELVLMSFESYLKYREYYTINHKWYNVNHVVNETSNSL